MVQYNMAPIVEQFIRFFTPPNGNLFYSSVLGLCAFSALLACKYAQDNRETSICKRMQLGLLFIFLIQLLLFGAAWLAWMGIVDGHSYLPPVDRTLALCSLVLVIWLWAFPKTHAFADGLVILLEGAIVLLGAGSLFLWLRQSTNSFFNTSIVGSYTYYAGLGFLVLGLILLLGRRPRYWGFGFLMLSILIAGYITQFFVRQASADYGWFVHLGEMVAYVVLMAVPMRLVGLKPISELAEIAKPIQLVSRRIDAKLIQSVINLIVEPSPQQFYQELTRLVAQVMDADFCLLMIPPKTGEQLIAPVGYSQLEDRNLDGFATDGNKIPSLLQALKSSKTLHLAGINLESEGQVLSQDLGIKQLAQLLMVPFHPKGTIVGMGIVVLSKSLDSTWNEDDALQLKDAMEVLALNIGQYSKGISQPADQGEMMKKLQNAQASADQVRLEYAQLKAKYDSIAVNATGSTSQIESVSAWAESQKTLLAQVKKLETRNRELENLMVKSRPSMEEVEQLRQELRSALVELARMPSTLSKSDQKMLEVQLSAVKRLDEMQPAEVVSSIAQEFRQPLSSIIGYSDLLLGESAGLIGAMQRKFLERVKASAERLGILLNELIQVMSIDAGKVDQSPMSVDIEPSIDEAVGNIIAQISEKNITMRVDLPEKLPAVRVNKDAIQQILANLLQNACLVTPQDGEIRLYARAEQREDEIKYMLISVTDQGGGIGKTDLPKVFSRRYKVENPLIQGIGDTGVGLSIVKSLVELHKGRIWVDSQEGVGSTFSVLLPLVGEQTNQINPINPAS